MRIYLFLGRAAKLYGAIAIAAIGVLGVLGFAIGIDAWVVNHSGPKAVDRVHLRYYVLPLGGAFLAAIILWKRVIPAGHDFCLALCAETTASPVRSAVRTAGWLFVAAAVFFTASLLQRATFGFFLPS
jgi:hypothetical protein